MQRNFILTDVMQTGPHENLEFFINQHTFTDQIFHCTGEYYTMHEYDLDSYDRKFAIIDVRKANIRIEKNKEFFIELQRRCNLLHSQGFVFIKATPWESIDNLQGIKYIYPDITLDHIKWTGGLSWFWIYMYRKHKDTNFQFDHSSKKYDFLYLNKMPRPHRKKLYERLQQTDLLSNSLYTYWPQKKLPTEYELPWAKDYPQYGMDQDIYEKPYNHTKFSLISETNDNNFEIFMTEKIWKPIIAGHVFIIHGNHLYLQKLKELGFKTFNHYFDESYDLESDKTKRIEKIIQSCVTLKNCDWKDLYLQTKSLREHNYRLFFDKNKIGEMVNSQLELFLEFADSSKIGS